MYLVFCVPAKQQIRKIDVQCLPYSVSCPFCQPEHQMEKEQFKVQKLRNLKIDRKLAISSRHIAVHGRQFAIMDKLKLLGFQGEWPAMRSCFGRYGVTMILCTPCELGPRCQQVTLRSRSQKPVIGGIKEA